MSEENVFLNLDEPEAAPDRDWVNRMHHYGRSRALVAVFHGEGLMLAWSGATLAAWLDDVVQKNNDSMPAEDAGIYCEGLADGLYVFENFRISGSRDYWTGEYDAELDEGKARPATKEEWQAHLAGEWPWDPDEVDDRILARWLVDMAEEIRK